MLLLDRMVSCVVFGPVNVCNRPNNQQAAVKSLGWLSDVVEHRQGQHLSMLFTLTFAVSVRNESAARNLQSLDNIQLLWSSCWSSSLEDNLVIHHKDLSRHKLIQACDSGQIEALDRDYVKASSMSQSAPYPHNGRYFCCPDTPADQLIWFEI